MATDRPDQRPLRERLLWFALLYAAGAAVMLVVVLVLKALI